MPDHRLEEEVAASNSFSKDQPIPDNLWRGLNTVKQNFKEMERGLRSAAEEAVHIIWNHTIARAGGSFAGLMNGVSCWTQVLRQAWHGGWQHLSSLQGRPLKLLEVLHSSVQL